MFRVSPRLLNNGERRSDNFNEPKINTRGLSRRHSATRKLVFLVQRERERERETDRECVCVCLSDASGPRHSRTIKRGYQLDPREPPLAPIRDCFERVPLTLTVERDFYLTNRSPFFRSTGGKINRQTGPSVVDPLDHFSSRSRAETRKGCSFTR